MKSRSKKSRNAFENFGGYLKAQRLKLGYNQDFVSEELGITAMFVSNIELDKCKIPLKHLRVLIKVYGLNKKEVIDQYLSFERKRLERDLK